MATTQAERSERTLHEAIGWLVTSAGQEFMLLQVHRAEKNYPEVAAVLQDWCDRLTTPNRDRLIAAAAEAITNETVVDGGPFPAKRWAEAALRGAEMMR